MAFFHISHLLCTPTLIYQKLFQELENFIQLIVKHIEGLDVISSIYNVLTIH